MKAIIAFVLVVVVSFSAVASEGAKPKLKSETTARVLSFMPLNSPALFYVRKPIHGVVFTALEGLGICIITVASVVLAKDSNWDDSGLTTAAGALVVTGLMGGTAMYLGPWIYTAVKTPDYVEDVNAEIYEKYGRVSFAPLLDIREDKNLYGLKFQYKF